MCLTSESASLPLHSNSLRGRQSSEEETHPGHLLKSDQFLPGIKVYKADGNKTSLEQQDIAGAGRLLTILHGLGMTLVSSPGKEGCSGGL